MAISNLFKLEQMVQLDVQSDKRNLQVVQKLLKNLEDNIEKNLTIFMQCVCKNTLLPFLVKNLLWLQNQTFELNDYEHQQSLLQFLKYEFTEYDKSSWFEEDYFELLEVLHIFTYFESELIRQLRKEGYQEAAAVIRALVTVVTKNRDIKALIELKQVLSEMNNVLEDLEREKRKCETKLQLSKRDSLLVHLKEKRLEYQKDTIMLITGLLKSESDYYQQLKTQLDDQYNHFIQEKLVAISKLVNIQEKVFIDEYKINKLIKNYKHKILIIIKKIEKS